MSFRLSAEERATLARDGLVVRERVFDGAECAAIAAHCEALVVKLETARRDDKRAAGSYLFELQRDYAVLVKWEPEFPDLVQGLEPFAHVAPELRAWGLDQRLVDPAKDLVGEEALCLFTEKLNVKRARRGGPIILHQDFPYWERVTPMADRICTAMIFIDDASLENGCLEVAPGSHTVGKHPQRTDDPAAALEMDPQAFDVSRLIPLEVPAGSVAFFGSLLVHRSAPNRSAHDRRALLYSYQAEGQPHLRDLSRPRPEA